MGRGTGTPSRKGPAGAEARSDTRAGAGRVEAGRVRELVTPEGVDLRLRIGDAAERAGALILDLLIMVGVLIALTIGSCSAIVAAGAAKSEAAAEASVIVWIL